MFQQLLRAKWAGIAGLVWVLTACGGGEPDTAHQAVKSNDFAELQSASNALLATNRNSIEAEKALAVEKSTGHGQRQSSHQVIELPSAFNGNGWYWNSNESGTGIFIEAQGDQAFVGFFMYNSDGSPTWYVAKGSMTQTGRDWEFSGMMQHYFRGQSLSSSTWKAPEGFDIQNVRIALNGSQTLANHSTLFTGTAFLPGGRQMALQRFQIQAPAVPETVAKAGRPETGWYWDPAAGGRGWAIESQGDTAFLVIYHYDANGSPVWNLVKGPWINGRVNGALESYRSGQTLLGSYRAPVQQIEPVSYTLTAIDQCRMIAAYPGIPSVALSRFKLASIPTNAECRSKYFPDLLNADSGSIAASNELDGLAGHWFPGSGGNSFPWGMSGYIDSDGTFNLVTIPVGSVRQVGSGQISIDALNNWRVVSASARDTVFNNTINTSGSGTFVPLRSMRGDLFGSVNMTANYSAHNARSVGQKSLAGAWVFNGIEIYIQPDGTFVGKSSATSVAKSCSLSGKFTQSGASSRNMFNLQMTAANEGTSAATNCALTSTAITLNGKASILRYRGNATNDSLQDYLSWSLFKSEGAYWQIDLLTRQ